MIDSTDKQTSSNQLSLSTRVIANTMLAILLTAIVVAGGFAAREWQDEHERLESENIRIIEVYADNADYAVFTQDTEVLQAIVNKLSDEAANSNFVSAIMMPCVRANSEPAS